MAELLLKVGTVGPDPRYQDGDIVCAWNDRMVSQRHLSILSHPRRLAPGHRLVDSNTFDYCAALCKYKFERISRTEVRRTDRDDILAIEVFSATPNIKGEQIHLEEFISRRLKHNNHRIFGTPGSEIWFGGNRDYSTVRLDTIWDAITIREGLLKADHVEFPITDTEKRHFLPISIVDLSDVEVFAFLSRDITDIVEDGEDIIRVLQKRITHVDWENLPGMTPGRRLQVRDGGRSADHRQSLGNFDKSIALEKTLRGRRSNIRI